MEKERFGWATINEVSESGFYAYKHQELYSVAKEGTGSLTYEEFSKMTGTKQSYLKRVLKTDFGALDTDSITFKSKAEAEAARDWLETMFVCKKAAAV